MDNITLIEGGASSEIKKDGFSLDLQGIESWLQTKTILDSNEKLISFQDLDKWFRSGGETYATTFQIAYKVGEQELSKKLIIKALISIPPEKHLEDWSKRRKLLKDNGVVVSHWYWFGNAVVIEDFYPYTTENTKDFTQLIQTAMILDKLGFNAIDFLRDMRCNQAGIAHYIDFGFDLGEFSYFAKTVSVEKLKATYPEKVEEIENFIKHKK